MISEIFESVSRWPGAPKICVMENLPAFETVEDALAFHEKNGPGNKIVAMWICGHCEKIHYRIKMRPPSGDSSGSSRR